MKEIKLRAIQKKEEETQQQTLSLAGAQSLQDLFDTALFGK
jgi:hypothetical protein